MLFLRKIVLPMKCIKKYLLAITFLPFLASGCEGIDQSIPLQSEKVIADNISNSCVTCFAEDQNGFLWIGTERGLNKYTGNEYSQYYHSSSKQSLLSNKITALFVSSDNTLWVGTSTGINSFQDDESFKKYDIASTSKVIGEIFEHNGDIYTTTLGHVLKYDKARDTFDIVLNLPFISACFCCVLDEFSMDVIFSNHICRYDLEGNTVLEDIVLDGIVNDAYYDGSRFVYLATTEGLVIYDNIRNIIEYQSDFKNSLETVTFYEANRVIVSSGSSLFIFNNIDHSFTPFTAQYYDSEYNISTCLVDSNKNIWIGYSSNGYHILYKYDSDFYAENGILKNVLIDKNITSISCDSSGRIWCVVDHCRLFVFENDILKEIDLFKSLGTKLTKLQSITNFYIDSDDNLNLCINYTVVKCRYDGICLKPLSIGSIFRSRVQPQLSFGSLAVSDYIISSTLLIENKDKSFVCGTVDGNFRVLSNDFSKIETFPVENKELTHMGAMIKMADGKVLGGFYGRDLQIFDPEKKNICGTIPLTKHISNYFYLSALCEDKEGGIWVGTRAEGVYHIFPDYVTIEKISNVPCDDICAIVCDNNGDIWISTYDGLCCYRTETGTITNYYKEDGTGGNQFNYMSAAKLADGNILFGGTHGLTVIDPNEEAERAENVPFHFDNLFVNNSLVIPYSQDIIGSNLTDGPEVHLKPNNRQITITFSAIDYGNRNHIRYSYSLDSDSPSSWTGIKNGSVSFSKFPYGKHTFYARIESADNPEINQVISLDIFAQRPVFLSIGAVSIYIIIALTIAVMFVLLQTRLYRSKLEQKSQQQTNEMNMRFFANVSHEFRTPLTMVNGAIKQLDGSDIGITERHKLYGIINRNANRMITLVNQLMDFKKLEDDVLALNVRKVDALLIIDRIVNEYRFSASLQNDTLKFRSGVDMITMWLDEDKMEKIMYNILSNAVKFTPSGTGIIAVDADLISRTEAEKYFKLTDKDIDDHYLFVSIFNSESFIPEDKLDTVFERYAQLEQGEKVGGTGIGLYFTKRLVEIHHGHIKASNKRNETDRNRSGVVFTFILPVSDLAYSEAEKASMELPERNFVQVSATSSPQVVKSGGNDKLKPTLLVIDDDAEIIYYLDTLLSGDFNVISAKNAEDGFKEMGQQNPDIVLCDILMPGTDGFELCSKVKSDLSVCHIPFILLTAKFSIDDQIKGLNCGANAYVMKPFDPDYLVAILNSQLSNRNKLRDALTHNTESSIIEENIKDELDKKFIAALYDLMEKSISKPDMDVTEMAKSLNVSRSQLYYKVRALTGETPHAFFNKYKLNIAAKWIMEDKYKISAIAQDLGFVSASHFTAIFKKEFGCLPSDYKDLNSKANL